MNASKKDRAGNWGGLRTWIIPFLLTVVFSSCRESVREYAATESYPEDSTLNTIAVKKAMILIAHDDDMCTMSGTISKLNRQGWEIQVLSFPLAEERNQAHRRACEAILDQVSFYGFGQETYRNDLTDSTIAHEAIPKADFDKVFNRPLVEAEMIRRVNEFGPTVVFSLDNDIGGYGHPDHVLISQLVRDLAEADSIHPQYIYQSVYTRSMMERIMARHDERMKKWGFEGGGWERAKRIYRVEGMPIPDVQVNIVSEAEAKMAYLGSYNERERKTIGFYIPAFEDYSAKEYFGIFDREFFRVLRPGTSR